MTGLWIMTRGSSLRNASGVDFHSILGSRKPPPTRRAGMSAFAVCGPSEAGTRFEGVHGHQCSPSANGPSASAGK